MKQCEWATSSPLEQDYHDKEWGVPVHDDRRLFEFLILEGAQAGLSWSTILKKRDGYQEAFDGFDTVKISSYTDDKIQELLSNPGIVRNKLKVNATIVNANAFLKVKEEFGSFNSFIWSFVDDKVKNNSWVNVSDVPASTPESYAMSKELKKRGFKFVGPTICYAFMQAVGMVNDHITDCFRYSEIRQLAK